MPGRVVTNHTLAGAGETLAVWELQKTVHRLLARHSVGPQLAGAPDTDVVDGWTRTVCAAVDDVHRRLVGKTDRGLPSWSLAAEAVVLVLEEQASIAWHVRQAQVIPWRKALTDRALDLASIAARITKDHRTTRSSTR